MSTFDIVVALLSFVYALALTHLLQGLAQLIQARTRVRWSLVHASWMLLALVILVNNWLAIIPLQKAEWTTPVILMMFALSALQYFTCSLLMPPVPEQGEINLHAFQLANGWTFIAPYILMLGPVIGTNYVFNTLYGGANGSLVRFLAACWPLYVASGLLALSMWRRETWLRAAIPLALSVKMMVDFFG